MEKSKRLMDKIVTVCYGKEETWESKKAAEQFFLRAMMDLMAAKGNAIQIPI